jgi:MFS transporter, SP family, galactose:H+ symporter
MAARPEPVASAATEPEREFPSLWMGIVLGVVVLAGALFGYDQGVISGALAGIRQAFGLSSLVLEVVTSWVTLGALFGSLLGGHVADQLGRRRAVLIAAVMFIMGAAIEAFAPGPATLVLGRATVGVGVGIAAVAAPLYGAELAPAALRGRFVASYQLAITVGIFLAYLVDASLAGSNAWRTMLGMSAIPGILLLLTILVAPESSRWLMKRGRREEARATIHKLRPGINADIRLDAMQRALRTEDGAASWSQVFAPEYRKPLALGIGLAVFQQITGINAIIYYSDAIFAAAGFTSTVAQTQATTWAIGGVNVLATFIAIGFIDRLGRRPLLLAGIVGMGVSLLAVGTAFLSIAPTPSGGPSAAGMVTLAALVLFIGSFAFSLGPVVWTVINEIFPGRVRGRAVAIATAANWGAAFIVSQFFLTVVSALGAAATFWLLACFCLVGWVWIYRHVPETRGRSLEQIEQAWTQDERPNDHRRSRIW